MYDIILSLILISRIELCPVTEENAKMTQMYVEVLGERVMQVK